MRFIRFVQNNSIPWPTSKHFDPLKWNKQAGLLVEDDADANLAEVGRWVHELLESIRSELGSSAFWNLDTNSRNRFLLGLSNFVFIVNTSVSDLGPLVGKDGRIVALSIDELSTGSGNRFVFGSGKLSDHTESVLDFAERCLNNPPPQKQHQSTKRNPADDLKLASFTGSAYQLAELLFLKALWLGWQLVEDESFWRFLPADIGQERVWEASLRRTSHRQSEVQALLVQLWSTAPEIFSLWPMGSGGLPNFAIHERKDVILIDFKQRLVPPSPPSFLADKYVTKRDYYTLLLEEPLPNLDGKCLRDILELFFTLSLISDEIINHLPFDGVAIESDDVPLFCPALQRKSLVNAISKATSLRTQDIRTILKALTWSAGKSLWFHPLVIMPSKMGPAYCFALLPLLAPNIHWWIEYWLTEFGLSLERRGELFEKQIISELNETVDRNWAHQQIKVAGPRKLKSNDGSSEEEFDLLLLIDDLLVVGEAKCQKYPMTPVETHNYLRSLSGGAAQATRKAKWALDNLNAIGDALDVSQAQFAGKVQPIIISNHPLGVGMTFDGVPVVDLLLLSNYFSRPFLQEMRFDSGGLSYRHTSTKFYDGLQEMADYFPAYVTDSPFMRVYLDYLEPDFRPLPFVRAGKPLQMLQFRVRTT